MLPVSRILKSFLEFHVKVSCITYLHLLKTGILKYKSMHIIKLTKHSSTSLAWTSPKSMLYGLWPFHILLKPSVSEAVLIHLPCPSCFFWCPMHQQTEPPKSRHGLCQTYYLPYLPHTKPFLFYHFQSFLLTSLKLIACFPLLQM